MKSLKELLEDIFQNQQQGNTIELPKQNLVVSVFEQEKKLNFSPLDKTKPAPQARTFINQLKQKFKVLSVQQQQGNIFVVSLDPREDINIIQDFLQQSA